MRQKTVTSLFSFGSRFGFSQSLPMNSGESAFSFKLFLLVLASKGFLLDWIDIISPESL